MKCKELIETSQKGKCKEMAGTERVTNNDTACTWLDSTNVTQKNILY